MVVVGSRRWSSTTTPPPTRPSASTTAAWSSRRPSNFGEYQLSYRSGDIIIPRLDAAEPLSLELAGLRPGDPHRRDPRSHAELGSRSSWRWRPPRSRCAATASRCSSSGRSSRSPPEAGARRTTDRSRRASRRRLPAVLPILAADLDVRAQANALALAGDRHLQADGLSAPAPELRALRGADPEGLGGPRHLPAGPQQDALGSLAPDPERYARALAGADPDPEALLELPPADGARHDELDAAARERAAWRRACGRRRPGPPGRPPPGAGPIRG